MSGNVLEKLTPPYVNLVDQQTINILSPQCVGPELSIAGANPASSAFTANLIIYIPLVLAEPLLVSQFFWINGATVDGNSDVGIYSFDGATKLGSSGSTLNAGTTALQAVNVADFYLPANSRFWMALGCDSSVQTFWRTGAVIGALDAIGIKQQAAGWSSGLPATATLNTPTVAHTPFFGFTGKAVL